MSCIEYRQMETGMTREKTEQDVLAFLAEELGLEREKLSIWTRLREDLKLDGDAANELIVNYAYAFHVDIEGFRVNDYFNAGTGGNPSPFLAKILWLFGNATPLKTLTVRDLVDGAMKGSMSPSPKAVVLPWSDR